MNLKKIKLEKEFQILKNDEMKLMVGGYAINCGSLQTWTCSVVFLNGESNLLSTCAANEQEARSKIGNVLSCSCWRTNY